MRTFLKKTELLLKKTSCKNYSFIEASRYIYINKDKKINKLESLKKKKVNELFEKLSKNFHIR